MVLDWIKSQFSGKGGKGGGDKGGGEGEGALPSGGDEESKPKRNPLKARRFFEHAQTVADARQLDYAIQLYINGLRHEPDNMAAHEALYEVAKKRRISGGKPAGLSAKLSLTTARDPIERMLLQEQIWAMNPLNKTEMLGLMDAAVKADLSSEDLRIGELVFFIGKLVLEDRAIQQALDKYDYLKLRDLFAAIRAFDKATEACRMALAFTPDDANLQLALKEMMTERMIEEGGYTDKGDFRDKVKDIEKQTELENQDAVSQKTERMKTDQLAKRKAEFEENPNVIENRTKYIDALRAMKTDETEAEAIRLLEEAYKLTDQYRFRATVGDIKMKQRQREMNVLKGKLDSNPKDAALKKMYDQERQKQIEFELAEYDERVKAYPTDLPIRFELGTRLFQAGRHVDAIAQLQMAKADPKVRAMCTLMMGKCFQAQGYYDEAVTVLEEGIANHQVPNDKAALELNYLLMDSLEHIARQTKSVTKAKKAQEIASKIVQIQITYRDIQNRNGALRKLVTELEREDKL